LSIEKISFFISPDKILTKIINKMDRLRLIKKGNNYKWWRAIIMKKTIKTVDISMVD